MYNRGIRRTTSLRIIKDLCYEIYYIQNPSQHFPLGLKKCLKGTLKFKKRFTCSGSLKAEALFTSAEWGEAGTE